jgi:low molecular weight protein-tyrosine phosphatase
MTEVSSFRILAVCTGNVCRSPFIERLLRARLTQRFLLDAWRFEVTSAGTGSLAGNPMDFTAAETLRRHGGEPRSFIARDLNADLIERSDLVLAAAREHRSAVVTLVPRATAKSLTLLEFARLVGPVRPDDIVGDDPVERMRLLVATAMDNRGLVPPSSPADDDVPDPYRRDRALYDRAADLMDDAVTTIVSRI